MKILVTEMPLCMYDCPFSKEYTCGLDRVAYDCAVTKEDCDLDCGTCSGLKVLKIEE